MLNIRVGDVISGQVYACTDEDNIRAVLNSMKEHQVRRLPVIDRQGRLVGIISMNDIVRTSSRKGTDISSDQVLETFRSIGARPETVPLAEFVV